MIEIKTPQEIEIMAEGGRILAKIMNELKKKDKARDYNNGVGKTGRKFNFKGRRKMFF